MKRTNKQIFGNVILTVALVGGACLGVACISKVETASSGIVTYSTGSVSAPAQSVGDHSWLMPRIDQSDLHASSAAPRRAPRAVAQVSPASSHSIISTGLTTGTSVGGGSTSAAGGSSQSLSSSAAGNVSTSGSVSFGSIPQQSMVGATNVSQPFAESSRPQGTMRPRVDIDGGKDEPFYEPIGDGLYFLLLCGGLFALLIRRKTGSEYEQ